MTVRSVDVLGLPVQAHTMASLVARMEEMIASEGCRVAYGVNAHTLNLIFRIPGYRRVLQRADVLYADGASVLLAAAALGEQLPEKLTTTDVWPVFCAFAERRGYRFFLLGGEPGLAENARSRTLERFPGLHIAGVRHGYFEFSSDEILSIVNDARPDVLWLGIGEPRQALWADAVRDRLNAGLVMTCGGMFKIISGSLKRAPPSWRRRGFEWLYRMAREPGVWRRYGSDLPAMAIRVLVQRFFGKTRAD